MSIYIAATRQNDGKTVTSLGLLSVLRKKIMNVGYMKPVGQQFQIIRGKKVGNDAALMRSIFSLKDKPSDITPITIPPGFTENTY
ncbi:MAG: dethiobiotin synthase [Candidatus Omnitrophota bacterium]